MVTPEKTVTAMDFGEVYANVVIKFASLSAYFSTEKLI